MGWSYSIKTKIFSENMNDMKHKQAQQLGLQTHASLCPSIHCSICLFIYLHNANNVGGVQSVSGQVVYTGGAYPGFHSNSD